MTTAAMRHGLILNHITQDPVFALIREHERREALIVLAKTDADIIAASEAVEEAWDALLEATPITIKGAARVAGYVALVCEKLGGEDIALDAVTRLAAMLTRMSEEPEPIPEVPC